MNIELPADSICNLRDHPHGSTAYNMVLCSMFYFRHLLFLFWASV
jgi:hypothetical protein